MWVYEKRLQFPVNIRETNAKLAQAIISQYGGADGGYIKIGLAFEAELFRIRLISIRVRLYLYIRLCIIISIFIIIFSFITACTDIRYLCLTGSVFLINSSGSILL